MSDASWAGGVAVVTGGGSGLGAALAGILAAEGMHVALADIDLPNAEKVAQQLQAAGATARAFRVDVGDPASLDALAGDVAAALGPWSRGRGRCGGCGGCGR